MKTKVGLWIDHKKAIIITITDKTEEKRLTILSKVEKQLRRSGDSPLKGPFEPHQVPQEDSRKRAFKMHLDTYYDAIIASILDAESILIFGPGEAKSELEGRLKRKNLGGRIVSIETVDKMTDPQITAKVRQYFHDTVLQ